MKRDALFLPGFLFLITLLLFSASANENYAKNAGQSFELPLMNRFRVVENVLYLNCDMRMGDKIVISDMKGKRIFGYTHEVDISKLKLPAITPGMYLVSRIRNGRLINKNQVVIGMASQ